MSTFKVFFVTFGLLASCKSRDYNAASESMAAKDDVGLAVHGTWRSHCVIQQGSSYYSMETLRFEDGVQTNSLDVFKDSACKQIALRTKTTQKYAIVKTMKEGNFFILKSFKGNHIEYEFVDKGYFSFVNPNAKKLEGFKDWKVGQKKTLKEHGGSSFMAPFVGSPSLMAGRFMDNSRNTILISQKADSFAAGSSNTQCDADPKCYFDFAGSNDGSSVMWKFEDYSKKLFRIQ